MRYEDQIRSDQIQSDRGVRASDPSVIVTFVFQALFLRSLVSIGLHLLVLQ